MDIDVWVQLASAYPRPWIFINMYLAKQVQMHYAQWQMGIRTLRGDLEVFDAPLVQCACQHCNSVLLGMRALEMHLRRVHGKYVKHGDLFLDPFVHRVKPISSPDHEV